MKIINVNHLSSSQRRKFREHFGCYPSVCCRLWNKLRPNISNGSRKIHMLFSLLFLKVYGTEGVLSSIAGVTEKTFRKWYCTLSRKSLVI